MRLSLTGICAQPSRFIMSLGSTKDGIFIWNSCQHCYRVKYLSGYLLSSPALQHYIEALSPFPFQQSTKATHYTCLHSSFLPRAHAHLAKAKSKKHTVLNKMPLTWVTEWDAEEKHSLGDKVKGVMPKNFAMNKTNQKQKSHPSGSCLPRGTPQIRTAHDSSISQRPHSPWSQDIQACWDPPGRNFKAQWWK